MATTKEKARAARSSARSRAAAGGGGKPVKLLKDPGKMTPADRIRYYLGLPQGYPMNPSLASMAEERLEADLYESGVLGEMPLRRDPTALEAQLWHDLSDAESATDWANRSYVDDLLHEGESGSPDDVFEYGMAREFGFRDPGESISQARARQARAQGVDAENREWLGQVWDAEAREAARSGYTPAPGERGAQSLPGEPPDVAAQRAQESFYPAGGPPWHRERLEELRVRREAASRARTKARGEAAKRPHNPRVGTKRKHGSY